MKVKRSSLEKAQNASHVKKFKSNPSTAKKPVKPSYDWIELLNSDSRFKAAPVNLFGHLSGAKNWPTLANETLKVEFHNPDAALPSNLTSANDCYWVARVINVAGFYLQLRFEGFEDDDSNDFWAHILDPNLHQIGYSKSENKHLLPPRSIVNKQTDWKNYLLKRLINSSTLPVNFREHVKSCLTNRFRVGLRLEAFNVNRSSSVCVARVINISGSRLQVAYEGHRKLTPRNSFWTDQASTTLIHPVGWAQLLGHELEARLEYAESSKEKIRTGKWHEDDASFEYFPRLFREMKKKDKSVERFEAGMRLEAIDVLDHKYIRVAHVYKVLRYGYLMIGIDGHTSKDASDCFCLHKSKALPIDWCKKNRVSLTVPEGWESSRFNYSSYLKSENAIAAPDSLFEEEPTHGFKKGMYVEAVDVVEPHMICPAFIKQVAGQLIKISFIGWSEEFDQWLPYDASEIYPVGWCRTADYYLEHPEMPDPEEDQQEEDEPLVSSRPVKSHPVDKFPARLKKVAKVVRKKPIKHAKYKSIGKSMAAIERMNRARASSVSDTTFDDSTWDSFTESANAQFAPKKTARSPAADHSMDYTEVASETISDTIMVTEYDPHPTTSNAKGDHPVAAPAVDKVSPMEVDEPSMRPEESESRVLPANPYHWSVADFGHYLKINGLDDCVEAFEKFQINGRIVMGFNSEQIYNVLDRLGPSLKVSHKVEELKRAFPNDRA